MWLIAPIARLASGPRTTVRDGRPEIPERLSLLALKIFECQATAWYAGRPSTVKKLVASRLVSEIRAHTATISVPPALPDLAEIQLLKSDMRVGNAGVQLEEEYDGNV